MKTVDEIPSGDGPHRDPPNPTEVATGEASGESGPGEETASGTLAAVDLGSNSFRMVIARVVEQELQLVDRLREGVRLAASLDGEQNLSPEGQERALECLHKFGQRLRDIPPGNVRAVGTNTLRKARNREEFRERAEAALGHEIEVVSGQEEARLIYIGVANSQAGGIERRLVADIGGGSTELVIGQGFEPLITESLYMGCVSFTQQYFPDGKIDRQRFKAAQLAARLELRASAREFRETGWESCVGASGTIQAVVEILRGEGWSDFGITRKGLKKLRKALEAAGDVEKVSLKGLRRERARVLPGGVAILRALFKSLGIERMTVSSGAMREGLLYDLLGRIRQEDIRDHTVRRFMDQFRVDAEQAWRVERTAIELLERVAEPWGLDAEVGRSFLQWAARIHEIGLAIAHGGFHKHGAYLVANSDMPGFSFQDQLLLSLLVRAQRRKFPHALFQDLPAERLDGALKLCVLLRLAIVLNRGRSRRPPPELELDAEGRDIALRLPENWFESHPLTVADLEQEARLLSKADFKLELAKL